MAMCTSRIWVNFLKKHPKISNLFFISIINEIRWSFWQFFMIIHAYFWTFHPPPNNPWSCKHPGVLHAVMWSNDCLTPHLTPTPSVIMTVWHLNCAKITIFAFERVQKSIIVCNQVWVNLCYFINLSWSWGILTSTFYYISTARYWGVLSWNFYTPLFKRDHLWKPSENF